MTVDLRSADSTDDFAFIRALSPRLVDSVGAQIYTEAELLAFQARYIREVLSSHEPALTRLAWLDGERAGYVHVTQHVDEVTGQPGAHVSALCVTPAAEGRGVAHALMACVREWAVARGCMFLSLRVFEDHARARALYEHLGFRTESLNMVERLAD